MMDKLLPPTRKQVERTHVKWQEQPTECRLTNTDNYLHMPDILTVKQTDALRGSAIAIVRLLITDLRSGRLGKKTKRVKR